MKKAIAKLVIEIRTKKTFDAVSLMRKARKKIEQEWADKPRAEEIEYLRKSYAKLNKDSN